MFRSSLAALALVVIGSPAAERAEVLSVRKIWDKAPHNAFTRLVRFGGRWYCTFREGDKHVPGLDGTVRIIRSRDGETWESAALLAETGIDLRDPKINVTPDGRLMLLMGGSVYDGKPGAKRVRTGARPRVAFSRDGTEWSAPQPVLGDGQWLWDLAWHDGAGYGFSYGTDKDAGRLTLVRTTDGVKFDRVADAKLTDFPNETAVAFRPDGEMLALVRREKGDKHAQLGRSRPPYTEWTWQDVGRVVQGPALLVTKDGRLFYAGREFPQGPRTVFGMIDGDRCVPLATLPSGGDTSYPGLVEGDDGTVWMSYYASHEGKAAIYLARIRVAGK